MKGYESDQDYPVPVSLGTFNPLTRVGPPALLAVLGGCAALVGGRYTWPIAAIPGVILCVLGVRIAYDSGLVVDAERIREATPWNAATPLTFFRQISGATVSIFGVFFLGLAATGIARILS
jgi:hypothetical protein